MASQTYAARGLVLKRTKLGETDVICTFVSATGAQFKAVAKGARKPTSSFASRLEVFSVCDLLLVSGKSLDIVKEARLVDGHPGLRSSLERTEAASPMVDLLGRATQVGLDVPRLFEMTDKALSLAEQCSVEVLPNLSAAYLLKAMSLLGFQPSFSACALCGQPLLGQAAGTSSASFMDFSLVDGGVVCSNCRHESETLRLDTKVIECGQALLYATFDDVVATPVDSQILFELLRFIQLWSNHHLAIKLKSLDFLIKDLASTAL